MNSFDSMIERYKKELIDAKKRSIARQLEEVSAPGEETDETAAVQTQARAAESAADPLPDENGTQGREEAEAAPFVPEDEGFRFAEEPSAGADSFENGSAAAQALGALKVQVFMAGRAYPVSSANVVITGRDGRVYFDGFTDTNGAISRLLLPAPKRLLSQSPQETPPYAQYDIFVSHPRFQSRKYLGVPVFAGVESIQNIQLLPLGTDEEDNTDINESEPNELLMKGGEGNA